LRQQKNVTQLILRYYGFVGLRFFASQKNLTQPTKLIFMHGECPEELQLLDDDLLQILMEEINQPQDGQLSDFAPILQNILRQLLNK